MVSGKLPLIACFELGYTIRHRMLFYCSERLIKTRQVLQFLMILEIFGTGNLSLTSLNNCTTPLCIGQLHARSANSTTSLCFGQLHSLSAFGQQHNCTLFRPTHSVSANFTLFRLSSFVLFVSFVVFVSLVST